MVLYCSAIHHSYIHACLYFRSNAQCVHTYLSIYLYMFVWICQYDIYDVVVLIPELRWIRKKPNRTFGTTCWRHNCLLLYFSPWTKRKKKLVWYSVFIWHRFGNVNHHWINMYKYVYGDLYTNTIRMEETQWIWRWVICEWRQLVICIYVYTCPDLYET